METLNKFTDLHLMESSDGIIVQRYDGQYATQYGKIRSSGKRVRFFPYENTAISSEQLQEIARVMDIIKARFWDYFYDNVNTPNQ